MSEPNATKQRRTLTGIVLRKSGDKTVAVSTSRVVHHPLYHKRRTITKIYLAHDPDNEAQIGKKVVIGESRPLSARKRWRIVEFLALAKTLAADNEDA